MAEPNGSWVVVRDEQRMLMCDGIDRWDLMTFLAALSSDPRSWEELGVAWTRFRPGSNLMDLPWRAIDRLPERTQLAEGGTEEDEPDELWIDLANQQFALPQSDNEPVEAGPYRNHLPADQYVWLNIPPWWHRQAINDREIVPWSMTTNHECDGPVNCSTVRPVDNFREVLFGREFIEYAADQMLSQAQALSMSRPRPKTVVRTSRKRRRAISQAILRKRRGGLNSKVALQTVRQVHAEWLMTPRDSLAGQTPRDCLHWQRNWKDRELDFRRAQWSRENQPPPGVPKSSHLYQCGPMGIEEVVCYFDMCRELLTMALRWAMIEPDQSRASLMAALLSHQQRVLDGPAVEGGDGTLRMVLDGDRQLMPRLANSDPFDCDCPLCRMQASNSELFGPAFMMCDGYHLEMEDDFAFSLYADRDEWETMREPWPEVSADSLATNVTSESDGEVAPLNLPRFDQDVTFNPGSMVSALNGVWRSSGVTPTNDPRLSLFSIGARLAELIDLLKEKDAPRSMIEQLNLGFDQLGLVIRNWLVDQAEVGADQSASIDAAVTQMIERLEEVTEFEAELTGHSADLQSLVHQWQRQLLTPGV